jgi:hypothetical protein
VEDRPPPRRPDHLYTTAHYDPLELGPWGPRQHHIDLIVGARREGCATRRPASSGRSAGHLGRGTELSSRQRPVVPPETSEQRKAGASITLAPNFKQRRDPDALAQLVSSSMIGGVCWVRMPNGLAQGSVCETRLGVAVALSQWSVAVA